VFYKKKGGGGTKKGVEGGRKTGKLPKRFREDETMTYRVFFWWVLKDGLDQGFRGGEERSGGGRGGKPRRRSPGLFSRGLEKKDKKNNDLQVFVACCGGKLRGKQKGRRDPLNVAGTKLARARVGGSTGRIINVNHWKKESGLKGLCGKTSESEKKKRVQKGQGKV